MANHKSYMHGTFPSSMTNDKGHQFNHNHSTTHEDPNIRDRSEAHSVPGGGAPSFMSGHGGNR